MWSRVDAESLDKECNRQVVEDVLLQLIGGVLCQYFKESGLLREPGMLVEVVENLLRLRVACPCVISRHLRELEPLRHRLPSEMAWCPVLRYGID